MEEKNVIINGEADCSGDCKSCIGDCTVYDKDKQTITITTDDDVDIECRILQIFRAKDHQYIALLPLDGSTNGEAYLFRFAEGGQNDFLLDNIEDAAEYDFAARVFDNLVNNIEID